MRSAPLCFFPDIKTPQKKISYPSIGVYLTANLAIALGTLDW